VNPPDCIFCEIVAGRASASLVYEDDLCAVFMDIQPVNPGHVLVIPKRHVVELAETTAEEWSRVTAVGQRTAAALRASDVRCEGVNLFLADGAAAGQEVFHAHLHVIPRYRGDGFGFRFPESYQELPGRTELDAVAADLKDALTRVSGGAL